MKIGYDNTMNKPASPLLQKVLPDPKVTKRKVARRMMREGEITKEEFKTYKKQHKAYGTGKGRAITSGDISRNANTKGDGGPNEEFEVAVPRGKWNRLQRKEKRAVRRGRSNKSTQKLDEKLRLKSPRVREWKVIPKEERTPDELQSRIDKRNVRVSDTKKAARKRYRDYKKKHGKLPYNRD